MRKRIVLISVLIAVFSGLMLSGCSISKGPSYIDSKGHFDADEYYRVIQDCADQIRKKTDFKPDIVIVLGSGLGQYADRVDIKAEIPYEDIKGFPVSTVPSHDGKLIFFKYGGKNIVCMKGRVHYYEGYSMYEVVLPLRVLHELGAKTVILTNAVGAINTDYKVGDFVCAKDHISTFVPSPLIGENLDELGPRFPDMTNCYDKKLGKLVETVGNNKNIRVHRGTLLQVTGPQFESPQEIKAYRKLGADTVGMSTVVEAIAARHMKMKVCVISSVTNMAAGIEDKEVSDEEITAEGKKSERNFAILLSEVLKKM